MGSQDRPEGQSTRKGGISTAIFVRKAAKGLRAALARKKNEQPIIGETDLEGLGIWIETSGNNFGKLGNDYVENILFQLEKNKFDPEYNVVVLMKALMDYITNHFPGARMPMRPDDDFDVIYVMVVILRVFGYRRKPSV